MPRNLANSAFMKPFVVLALPGMYLFYKYNQYKQQQQEQSRRKVTERELAHLNHKIDKLLTKLEENEPELATSQEEECVICVNAKATMQTSPCGHRVVCRKCFVKTIQMAVSQRLLPLRCVICRAKILRLKQSSGHGFPYSKSWLVPSSASSYSMSSRSWSSSSSSSSSSFRSWAEKTWVPSSASQYSMGSRSVPNSASMYSMSSGSSSLSGMSSVSSTTNSSVSSKGSSSSSSGGRIGNPRQPTGSLRKSQQYSMKVRIQEYNEPRSEEGEKPPRLPPIVEFQREYRLGKERATSTSTRIRCAQKIVTQLEASPLRSEKCWRRGGSGGNGGGGGGGGGSFTSNSFFKSSLRPTVKEEKKKDKNEEKRKVKTKEKEKEKEETITSDNKEGKDNKNDKKKGGEKKEETKGERKDGKNDKNSKGKKESKNNHEKTEKEKSEKETLL